MRVDAMKNVQPRALVARALKAVAALDSAPEEERIEVFNALQSALGALVRDVAPDPACSPQLLPVADVEANDYNPNHVAGPELDLLEQSMRADGITMCVVVVRDGQRATVVDGFHRRTVAADRLGRRYIPSAVIDKPLGDRMASTVRHNRARGKHGVELMGALVRGMAELGWDDARIVAAMGMSPEELLRLRQMVGAAKMLAAPEYGRAWEGRDGADPADP
jgi:ParB-like chromosome segregation protein Spo0J